MNRPRVLICNNLPTESTCWNAFYAIEEYLNLIDKHISKQEIESIFTNTFNGIYFDTKKHELIAKKIQKIIQHEKYIIKSDYVEPDCNLYLVVSILSACSVVFIFMQFAFLVMFMTENNTTKYEKSIATIEMGFYITTWFLCGICAPFVNFLCFCLLVPHVSWVML